MMESCDFQKNTCTVCFEDLPDSVQTQITTLTTQLETERRKVSEAEGMIEPTEAEAQRLTDLINTPVYHDFAGAVVLEAAHQRNRWGQEHDDQKDSPDWFWLIGYLAGKALRSEIEGDYQKALHHTITASAALGNWHSAIRQTIAALETNETEQPHE